MKNSSLLNLSSRIGLFHDFVPIPEETVWVSRTSANDYKWVSVCFGNGLFVAVARESSYTNSVMTSPDGITWTARTAAVAASWSEVIYDLSTALYIAVERFGRIMTSPDGITWTLRISSPFITNEYSSLASRPGLVLSPHFWGDEVADFNYSVNGINWEYAKADFQPFCNCIRWLDNRFVLMSYNLVNWKWSNTGFAWDWTDGSISSKYYNKMVFGNNIHIATSNLNSGSKKIITFLNPASHETLTNIDHPLGYRITDICFGDGIFVAISDEGGFDQAIVSLDGYNWNIMVTPATLEWSSIAYGNGRFVAVAVTGTGNRVMTFDRF